MTVFQNVLHTIVRVLISGLRTFWKSFQISQSFKLLCTPSDSGVSVCIITSVFISLCLGLFWYCLGFWVSVK